MKTSREIQRQARGIMRLCMVDGHIDEKYLARVLSTLRREKPRGHLALLTALHRLMRLELENSQVLVETATPPGESLKQELAAALAERHGPGQTISYEINPDLLGGLRLRLGNTVLDGSVRARLDTLAHKL